MAIKLNIPKEKQNYIVKHVSDNFYIYKSMLEKFQKKQFDIYKEYSTFEEEKTADWKTTYKVNKAHEVVNKILPRIMSKNPKWIVSSKPDTLLEVDKIETEEEKLNRYKQLQEYNLAIKDYLSTVFDKYNLITPARLWAKNMIIYWPAFAKIRFKYELWRTEEPVNEEETMIDENGQEIVVKKTKRMKEFVYNQYPTIDPKSFTEVYYNPKYKSVEDLPAIIEIISWVRLAELKASKDKYMNLDKLESIPNLEEFQKDSQQYRTKIEAICGISAAHLESGIDKSSLTVKKYYGLYDLDWEERLYEFCTVWDILLIEAKEISYMPFELIRCFEDTETLFAWWFVEPIMGLQKSMNFKKNSVSEAINRSLNPMWFWNPNSGINPKDLISRPWGIIPTTKNMTDVDLHFREATYNEVNASYWQEGNDIERQIQAMTFTVDTSNPNNQNSLTNTATGARIKMFEGNTVIEEVRKHFEKWLSNLAYKLLQETVENIEENIVIKKIWDNGFREINKEALKDAIKKYEINVEIGSSSFDSIEDRRDDAIAKFNMWLQASQAGVPVDLQALWVDVMNTFESIDAKSYIKAPELQSMMWGIWGTPQPLQAPEKWPSDAAALTEQVAQGSVVAWM